MSDAAPSLRARIDARLLNAPVGEPMSIWRIMSYSLPFIPLSALSTPITVYVPPFFTQDLGVSLAAAGLVFMLSRFWDIFTDPLMGMISDRYPTRYGRRRHWIVLSLPILMAASVLVFMPQLFVGDKASPAYLMVALFVLYLGYTLAVLSHMSWGAELATGYHERSRVQGWREFVHVIGMVSVLAIPIAFEQTGNAHDRGAILEAVGWYVIILLPPNNTYRCLHCWRASSTVNAENRVA